MRIAAAVVIALLYLMFMAWVANAQGFTLTGRLDATDQEADEGYFAIDQQTMLVVKPGSELHAFLRGQAGKRVRIVVEPAAE